MKKLISYGILFFLLINRVEGQEDVDKKIKSEKDLTKKALLISKYMEKLIQTDTVKYLFYAEEIKNISKQTNNPLYLRDYYDKIGRHFYFSFSFQKAAVYFDSSLQINIREKDTMGLLSSHVNLGGTHYMLRHFDLSLNHYLQASGLNENYRGKKDNKFSIKGNIGMVYREIGQPELAKKYFDESLKEDEKAKDTSSIIKALNNLGLIAKDIQALDEAEKYYKRGIELSNQINSLRDLSDLYFNFGNLKLHQKQYKEALNYFELSEQYSLQLGDESGTAETYLMIGECYIKLGNNSNALMIFKRALATANKYENHKAQMDVHSALYVYYNKINDYKNALNHLAQFMTLKTEVDKEENMAGAMLVKSEFEQEQKRQLDSIKHYSEKKIQEEQSKASLERQRNFTLFSIIAGILCMGIAGLSYFAYRSKKKSENEINHQKNELEFKNKEIISSIEYAKTIQKSQLTTESYILKSLKRLKP